MKKEQYTIFTEKRPGGFSYIGTTSQLEKIIKKQAERNDRVTSITSNGKDVGVLDIKINSYKKDNEKLITNKDNIYNKKEMIRELKKSYSEVYDEDDFLKRYTIESRAFGGILVSPKKSDELVIFFDTTSSDGEKIFYKIS